MQIMRRITRRRDWKLNNADCIANLIRSVLKRHLADARTMAQWVGWSSGTRVANERAEEQRAPTWQALPPRHEHVAGTVARFLSFYHHLPQVQLSNIT